MAPNQQLRFRRLSICNGERWIHLVEAGSPDAPPLLMIHGAAGSWHNWRIQIAHFSKKYRVIVPDLRGHGLSPWPGPSTIDDFVNDLVEVVNSQIAGEFHIFSHSFGGCLATHLYQKMPKRIQTLALLNTAGHIPQGLVYRSLQLLSHRANWARRFQPYAISCNAEVAVYITHKTLREWNTWSLLETIDCPTKVVMGKFDMLFPITLGPRLRRHLPKADFHTISTCGHVPMWESPDALNPILEELLAKAEPGSGQSLQLAQG